MRRGRTGRGAAGALALGLALATGAVAAGAGQPRAATVPAGPVLTLGTLWGPDFWQAVRQGGPIAYTASGDALVTTGGPYTNNPTLEELSPQGAVVWSTTAFGRVGSPVALGGGREIALEAQPMAGGGWGPGALYLFDPATGTLARALAVAGGIEPAGDNLLGLGGWLNGVGFAAVYDPTGHLLTSLVLPNTSQVVATPAGSLLLLPAGPGTLAVDAVDPVSGAIGQVAIWRRAMPTSVVAAGAHALLTVQQIPFGPGAVLGAWQVGSGSVRRLWSWGAGAAVGGANGDLTLTVTPDGTEFAIAMGARTVIGATATGAVVARLAQPGYDLYPVGALPDGFVVREVPTRQGDGVPLPERLSTYDLVGRPVDVAVLPAGANPVNESFGARRVDAGGVDLVATTGADDLVAVVPATPAAPLPAGLADAPLTLGAPPAVVSTLAVQAGGVPVGATQPLVVTAKTAGRPIPLRVVALNAAGAQAASSSIVNFSLSDGGHGGTFSPGATWGLAQGDSDVVMTYTNATPGSYVITATITRQPAAAPLFTVPKAVAAGAPFTVTVRPPGTSVRATSRLLVRPVAGSDVAAATPVTAVPAGDGTYTATFTAGATTGAAAFEAIVQPSGHDLGESAMVNVGNIDPPLVTVAATPSGRTLTIAPGSAGDRPIGFVVTPPDGVAEVVPYGTAPATVSVPATGAVEVRAVDADGAQSAAATLSGTG